METAICTLAEGNYHFGVGALANSLHKSGFRGKFFCGYRGALPCWFRKDRNGTDSSSLMEVDGMEVIYVPLDTTMHFANYKPRFMLDIAERFAPESSRILYFDPDIVVKCSIQTLERWTQDGVALCEGCMGSLPERHPLRLGWLNWLASWGNSTFLPRSGYYNSGFVGLERKNLKVLTLWEEIIFKVGESNGTLGSLVVEGRDNIFYIPDEYALNMALMCFGVAVNSSGLEGMDFKAQGSLLSHSAGRPKPWNTQFVRSAFQGESPTVGARFFAKHLAQPIQVMNPLTVRILRTRITLAAQISRWIKKTEYRNN